MKDISPEVRVGLLTIIVGVALLYISLRTAGSALLGGESYMTFYMDFSSVAGIELKSKVRLSGVEIGYVEDVKLQDNYARVVAILNREAVIRDNAIGTIRTEGLLGEKYIEIVQGTPDAPPLVDGALLARTQDPADISDMLNKLGGALDDIQSVTRSFKEVFGTLESQTAMKNTMRNLESASANLEKILAENRRALKSTIHNFDTITTSFAKNAPKLADNLEKVASGLQEIISENKENMGAGIANLRSLTAELNHILKENRVDVRTTMANLANASGKIDNVMESVENMSGSIERVASKVERGEGTVGRLLTDEEVYDNLNDTLLGAKKMLGKADDIRLVVGFRAERMLETDDNHSYLSLKIIPREDKHYLFEVSEDQRRHDLTTTRNTLNSLLYTILIAKRYSDLTIRGGLIESSAGLGAEYALFNDRFTFTADIFNFSGYDAHADNPQVKATLRWNFQKYLYIHIGADEMLNDYYRTYLFGGGIEFDENDLKLAIGLL